MKNKVSTVDREKIADTIMFVILNSNLSFSIIFNSITAATHI